MGQSDEIGVKVESSEGRICGRGTGLREGQGILAVSRRAINHASATFFNDPPNLPLLSLAISCFLRTSSSMDHLLDRVTLQYPRLRAPSLLAGMPERGIYRLVVGNAKYPSCHLGLALKCNESFLDGCRTSMRVSSTSVASFTIFIKY